MPFGQATSVQNFRTFTIVNYIWALSGENLILMHANKKGTDQSAHPQSLTSAVDIHSLETIIAKLDVYMQYFNVIACHCRQAGWIIEDLPGCKTHKPTLKKSFV